MNSRPSTIQVKKWTIIVACVLPVLFFINEIRLAFDVVNQLPYEQENFDVDFEYQYLIDDEAAKTVHDVLSNPDGFIPNSFNKAKVEFGNSAYWHSLTIKNVKRSTKTFFLLFDNPMLDYIDVYDVTTEPKLIRQLGDLAPSVDVEAKAFPHLKLPLAPGEEVKLLLRTTTLGAPNLPLAVFSEYKFERYKDAIYLIWGAFIGIVLLMAVYNLILYLGVSERLYLLYIGYIIAFLIELGIVHGFNAYLMPEAVFQWVSLNVITFNFLIGYFTMMFALYFFKFDQEPNSWITKITKGYSNLFLLCAVGVLFIPEYIAAQIFFPMQSILYVLAISMMAVRLKQGVKWANFYIISWLPLFVGAAVGPMLLTGNLDYNFWTRHALLLGVMFEMTFISMALAERLRQSEAERLFQASHDHVFGLANSSILERVVNRLSRSEDKKNFSVIAVSITKYDSLVPYLSQENLKTLVYGFLDDLRQQLGNQLILVDFEISSRYPDVVMVRDGVFAFIISSNDEVLVNEVLKRMANAQPLSYTLDNLSINVNYRFGVAAYEDIGDTKLLINKAQQAIDIAVESSLDYYIYCKDSKSEEGRRVRLASELQHAISNDDLELYHQPQLDIINKQVLGSEVLVRWNHPEFGFIPPDEFVAIAENTGLINKLCEWVFNKSCEHLRNLQDRGLLEHRVSVNFSAHDVVLESFATQLVKSLKRHNVKADRFTLELTETVFVSDPKNFNQNLDELKELGFKIAMDDFGTGYSSLSYVSQHPFDEIKIDQSFIGSLEVSEKNMLIVNAIVSLAESLEYLVVAEGIETPEALEYLQKKGCHVGQGYLFSQPLPFDDFLNWMDDYTIKHSFAG